VACRRASKRERVIQLPPHAAGGFVYTNTFIQPINLSWNLGGTPPDGTRQHAEPRLLDL
jgi:hypothetical protein